jgi:DNA-binding NtrC family response regulator
MPDELSPGSAAPTPSERQTGAENPPATAKKSAPPRLLVVDDESLVRWSVAEVLGERGYEVEEAHDAASAMHAICEMADRTDVVLLDLRLPDSDDLRLLSAMRWLSPATPVILMTAYGSPELREEARRLGAFMVIDKPFEMNELARIVDGALDRRSI